MSLAPGTRLGPYEVTSTLGAGGMGEVYRARDTKLNRDVALKALPEAFAQDATRVARFTREAQTLAALNHPNIAQIYGVEGEVLVMELVEGEDLSRQIARGPVPVVEALAIARQIADALESAHDQGIVHRDLKPANVKVRSDGRVKVLDFGLAKALDPSAGAGVVSGSSPSDSPTLTGGGTQAGMILGTAAYMAPEQARGKVVDRRADIWAFGVVLYEVLTGRRAFEGAEVSDVLAAVLRQDIDLKALPPDTPASVRRLLRRCLERDPRKRLSAIGDARLEIDEPETTAPVPLVAAPVHHRSALPMLGAALAGVALAVLVAYAMWPKPSIGPATPFARISVLPPTGLELMPDSTAVAISPDGTMVLFLVGSSSQGDSSELWVRSLDTLTARKLDDASRVLLPFWSFDSRRIGYANSTARKLVTIAAAGGRAEVVADAPSLRGAVWTKSNVILFAPDASGPISKVAATGGTVTAVTALEGTERAHRFPEILPDGDHFLYTALPAKDGKFDVFAASLSDPAGKRVFVGAMDTSPVYADPGYLLYTRQGVLAAVPFDAAQLKTTGDPILLDDEPASILDPKMSYTAGRSVSVSSTGSIAYYSAASPRTLATWIDETGTATGPLNLPPAHYDSAVISPDGTRAVVVRSVSASDASLWLVDLIRSTAAPLQIGGGRNDTPVWSPDGTRVVFASDRSGLQQLYVKNVNDSTPDTLLFSSDRLFKSPASWSPDGSTIVLTVLEQATAHDVWSIDASGKGEPKLLAQTSARDLGGPVSPNSKWLAYTSQSTGRLEVWVQDFPKPGHKVQTSESGGLFTWWTAESRQLIWAGADLRTLWRADVVPGATFSIAKPKQIATLPAGIIWIDAMPDRKRFLVVAPERTGTGSITIVQNWRRALEGKR